ncbi:cysteine-rich secretory protein [Clonorchis sinensis]|uniref:Cysteine-rich secretory protein n=1 Tax=Clonorchis sinensis TaxID=79923 RepID=G7Y400_CLOSI|nr:cysteine-rich secretory protein [Clonorchis sinensis]
MVLFFAIAKLIILVVPIFASQSQKGEVLTPEKFKELHNKYRKMVREGSVPNQPKAAEMPDLIQRTDVIEQPHRIYSHTDLLACKNNRIYIRQVLDDRLTADATKWAKNCVYTNAQKLNDGESMTMSASLEVDWINGHLPTVYDQNIGQTVHIPPKSEPIPPGRKNRGLLSVTHGIQFSQFACCPVTEWYKENESFKYGGITLDTFGKTSHYTQLVWADTKYLGCYQQLCDPLKFGKNGTLGKMYFSVCRYSPRLDGIPGAFCLEPYCANIFKYQYRLISLVLQD